MFPMRPKKKYSNKIKKPLVSVPDFSAITEPKTEVLQDFLNKLKVQGNILIIVNEENSKNENLIGAADGLDNVTVVLYTEMHSENIKSADCLVVEESVLKEITERL